MSDRRRVPRRLLTIEEYLRFEERAPTKHEYVAGRVYAMSGVSVTHERIVLNLTLALASRLRGSGCELFSKDLKVRVDDRVYYPDLLVRCGERLRGDTLVVTDPCLLVEVLSPGTRNVDRRDKRPAYQSIPELRTYLIVDQQRRHVERYWRDASGAWRYTELAGTGTVPLECLRARLTLDLIYADTDVPDRPLRRVRERSRVAYRADASPAE